MAIFGMEYINEFKVETKDGYILVTLYYDTANKYPELKNISSLMYNTKRGYYIHVNVIRGCRSELGSILLLKECKKRLTDTEDALFEKLKRSKGIKDVIDRVCQIHKVELV